ncbi:glycoside hydrolase family 28 protein [Mucilaginibacter sp. RS28]|uniref:Glycoside hydrolase family 28 protein n=1 Tax=Mucilaginibacter straminoryzae TaxID=2932774 RepID=A0A9X1X0F8_9SPHI|nr:glycoside hydrolase family 28 protein [Mucilaginibacter straminoryzae]MCJ8208511.1 glycoside hydrolase family 28 protein [Mucilaginibacter straminoryzae]
MIRMFNKTHRFTILAAMLLPLLAINASAQKNSGSANPFSGKVLPKVQLPVFKKDTINIKRYGAVPDGVTLNTQAINSAIAACSKKGGGVVVVPTGIWLTGPIVMQSNVNLHINRDAMLLFTKDYSQYKLVAGNWEGVPAARNQSPISGKNLQNIAITGEGIVDGNGDAWRAVKRDKLTDSQWKTLVESGGVLSEDKKMWYPSEGYYKGSQVKKAGVLLNGKTVKDFEEIKNFLRPNLVVLESCKKVLLEGVTFQNSPAWNLHPLMCEDITVRNVYAKNPWYAQNGDGIDLESCKNALIENSTFDVGDDGICIKSGRDEEGRKRGKPTENVIIRNCVVYHAHGGFVIGSEMSGGVHNMYVSNCTFIGTDIGLRFKTTRGRGGVVDQIYISDINMKDIVGDAILFDMYYEGKDPVPLKGEQRDAPKVETYKVTEATPQFKDFHVSNVVCNGAARAIFVRGLPEMNIADIWLNNMVIQAKTGMDCTEATNINLKNVKLITDNTNPVISIDNSKSITFDGLKYNAGSELLFNIGGSKTSDIKVSNTSFTNAKNKANFVQGASQQSLITN